MRSAEKTDADIRAMSIRVPADILSDMRKIKASIEVVENRAVSLNEMIVKAMKEFVKISKTLVQNEGGR